MSEKEEVVMVSTQDRVLMVTITTSDGSKDVHEFPVGETYEDIRKAQHFIVKTLNGLWSHAIIINPNVSFPRSPVAHHYYRTKYIARVSFEWKAITEQQLDPELQKRILQLHEPRPTS